MGEKTFVLRRCGDKERAKKWITALPVGALFWVKWDSDRACQALWERASGKLVCWADCHGKIYNPKETYKLNSDWGNDTLFEVLDEDTARRIRALLKLRPERLWYAELGVRG